jgi:hypothetical protein
MAVEIFWRQSILLLKHKEFYFKQFCLFLIKVQKLKMG